MNVVYDEAIESYQPESVVVLASDSMENLRENIDRMVTWINLWTAQNTSE